MFRQVLFNNAILIAQYTVSGLVPLLLVPHIVRTIGLASYGNLAVAIAWANYGCIVVQYAFHLTGPKRIAQLSKNESTVDIFAQFSVAKLILLAGVLSIFSLFLLSTSPIESASTSAYVIALALLPAAAALNSSWYLQATGHFLWVCTLAIIGASASLTVGFIFIVDNSQDSIIATAIALSLGPLLTGVMTFIISIKSLSGCIKAFRSANPNKLLREDWPLFISQFTAAIYSASGPILINWLSGAAASGAYSAVERFSNAITGACLLTHTAAYPRLAALYKEKRDTYWRLLHFVVIAYLACTIGISTTALLFHNRLSTFIFGTNNTPHSTLIAWSLLLLILSVFGPVVTGYLTVSGRQNHIKKITLRVLTISIALGIPGTIAFGAWAWMAALTTSQIYVLATAYKFWRKDFLFRRKDFEFRAPNRME